jgi:hypothetical protein
MSDSKIGGSQSRPMANRCFASASTSLINVSVR